MYMGVAWPSFKMKTNDALSDLSVLALAGEGTLFHDVQVKRSHQMEKACASSLTEHAF
jgi:hypothetical protein